MNGIFRPTLEEKNRIKLTTASEKALIVNQISIENLKKTFLNNDLEIDILPLNRVQAFYTHLSVKLFLNKGFSTLLLVLFNVLCRRKVIKHFYNEHKFTRNNQVAIF